MQNSEKLYKIVLKKFPDLTRFEIGLELDFDDEKQAWAMDLKKDQHHLKTYISNAEAENLLNGESCVSLGMQISMLKETALLTANKVCCP